MNQTIMPGSEIRGNIVVSGAKNSSLLLLAASVLATDVVVLDNIPPLSDVLKMCEILNLLGVETQWLKKNTLEIDPRGIVYRDLDLDLCGEIRTSVLFVGALLGRFGQVKVRSPGGCKLGPRPVNFHIDAMTAMGASISDNGRLIKGRLSGSKDSVVHFGKVSVTGVVNALFCAVTRHATTVIRNCALEPEVDDCIHFLQKLGANIKRLGSTITVEGGGVSGGVSHTVIPDRIEAGTFLILTMMVGGRVVLEGVRPEHMMAVLDKIKEAGGHVEINGHFITLKMHKRPKACDILACPYPGFPTDLQPQWCALSAISEGTASILDTVYSSRFDHMVELEKMGAQYEPFENGVLIRGVESLQGARTKAQNLRSAAALVLAARAAKTPSIIENISHLNRGYHHFFKKLSKVQEELLPVE